MLEWPKEAKSKAWITPSLQKTGKGGWMWAGTAAGIGSLIYGRSLEKLPCKHSKVIFAWEGSSSLWADPGRIKAGQKQRSSTCTQGTSTGRKFHIPLQFSLKGWRAADGLVQPGGAMGWAGKGSLAHRLMVLQLSSCAAPSCQSPHCWGTLAAAWSRIWRVSQEFFISKSREAKFRSAGDKHIEVPAADFC